ncbi:MBL fold metallo-hydrolase [Litoreibacter roseus]|nr:MBL fold metallo-hydrolase [Litoreibacter roseus]
MTIGPLPRMTPKIVGAMRVHALLDSVGPTRKPVEMLRDVPDAIVDQHKDWLVPNYVAPDTGLMIMAYQSFLIELGGKVILVDCAVGEDGNFPARPDWHLGKSDWLNHLGQAGHPPEDIDTVFLTHLHLDHTGWLTRKTKDGWVPSFPKARHVTSATELEFWPKKHEEFPYMASSIPDSVTPVIEAGLFAPIAPETEIATDLFVVDLAGHSPGMIGLEYRQDGQVLAAFNADLMHSPVQMAAPGCATMFCADPAAAVATRRDKLAQYAKDKTLMFCNHFPGECAGHAVPRGDGYMFVPVTG